MNYNEFVASAKKQGLTHLWVETTVFADGQSYTETLFALGKYRKLLGSYHKVSGGFMNDKHSQWSARGRTFKKTSF